MDLTMEQLRTYIDCQARVLPIVGGYYIDEYRGEVASISLDGEKLHITWNWLGRKTGHGEWELVETPPPYESDIIDVFKPGWERLELKTSGGKVIFFSPSDWSNLNRGVVDPFWHDHS